MALIEITGNDGEFVSGNDCSGDNTHKTNIAVLISGSGSNLQAVMDAVSNGTISNARVSLVISNREGAYGLERAKKNNIPNFVIKKDETLTLLDTLRTYKTNGVVLAGYLSILPPDVVIAYKDKIINIHPALLPAFGGKGFYGIRVHQAVLESGERYTGATAHLVDHGIDTGAILVQGVVPVLVGDTAEILQKRVLEMEHIVLVHAVKALCECTIGSLKKKPMILKNDDYESKNEAG